MNTLYLIVSRIFFVASFLSFFLAASNLSVDNVPSFVMFVFISVFLFASGVFSSQAYERYKRDLLALNRPSQKSLMTEV